MNILIVSYEAWRDTNNGGNVLSNVFCAFPDANITQIYCSGEAPLNSICQKYFQISDSMLLSSQKGLELEQKDYGNIYTEEKEVVENKIKNNVPSFLREATLLARELLWTISKWKTKELENFIYEQKPDVIFAPCYSHFHVSKLALYVKSVACCPMISYVSDDMYTFKQFRFSPSFWINRLITRKWVRKLFDECSLVYTMTEMQKNDYEKLLGCQMKILCKSEIFEAYTNEIGNPIRFIYAGGLYLNRWKILAKLSKALKSVNEEEIKAQLHIFSGSNLSLRKKKKINDGRNSVLHAALPYQDLIKEYRKSNVAVHVESFDLKNRLITRLSFSTKIIDCMNSGCAVLAIGPDNQAGISYLNKNDAAICINNIKNLKSVVNDIVNHPEKINEYSQKANQLGKKNHNKNDIEKMIRRDFYEIATKKL